MALEYLWSHGLLKLDKALCLSIWPEEIISISFIGSYNIFRSALAELFFPRHHNTVQFLDLRGSTEHADCEILRS